MILSSDIEEAPRLADSAKFCFNSWGLRTEVTWVADRLTTFMLQDRDSCQGCRRRPTISVTNGDRFRNEVSAVTVRSHIPVGGLGPLEYI